MLGARPEIGDHAQPAIRPGASLGNHLGVDPVGHCRHQHICPAHRGQQFVAAQRAVGLIEGAVEQFAHPRLDRVDQMAGDGDPGFAGKALRHGGIGDDSHSRTAMRGGRRGQAG